MGTFRGIRSVNAGFGGIAYGEKDIISLDSFRGYESLLLQIATFFESSIPNVNVSETIEIYAFMEAAEESMRKGGSAIMLNDVMDMARKANKPGI